jgi:hypothetical protein
MQKQVVTHNPIATTEFETAEYPLFGDLLTTERAAAYLGLRPKTLEFWRYQGIGPPWLRISRRCVRYRLRDLDTWLEKRSMISRQDEQ